MRAKPEPSLDWEKHLDEEIGVTLRLCYYYYYVLPDRERAMNFMMEDAPWYGRPLFAVIYPKVRDAMMQGMNINAESAQRDGQRLAAALANWTMRSWTGSFSWATLFRAPI
jgi:hypothetical protein